MDENLSRLGLKGPSQVHVAPVVLVPDERAHQVFLGFGTRLSHVLSSLSQRYIASTPAFVLRCSRRGDFTLGQLASYEFLDDDVLVVPAMQSESPGGVYGLVHVVDRLFGPGGCPWDQEQTHDSLKRHLIEECYELIDAIEANDGQKLLEEAGDVLLQPVMHAQMEKAAGSWDIDRVAKAVTDKLIRRHPHVFGDLDVASSEEVLKNWDAIKAKETGVPKSVLDGVPKTMPALLGALETSKRAARCGFEWPDIAAVWDKLDEELVELKDAVRTGEKTAEELGDVLFTLVNIGRWLKIDSEEALRQMVTRFSTRFKFIEANSPLPLRDLSAAQWDELWNLAKADELVS